MDRELIDRTSIFPNGVFYVNGDNPMTSLDELINRIHNAPTVDAVEVVRCKDCKHFVQAEHGCNHFGYYSHTPWVDEVDFCSYGERREGE